MQKITLGVNLIATIPESWTAFVYDGWRYERRTYEYSRSRAEYRWMPVKQIGAKKTA